MRIRNHILAFVISASCSLTTYAQNFTGGNVVVVRVGTGLETLVNTGAPVFLDEYTPNGVFVSQTVISTTAAAPNKILILGGTGTTEGLLMRSTDGHYLTLAGYDRILGQTGALSGTASAVVNRTIARIDATKNINITTALTDYATGSSPRSVITTDGVNFWATGGAGGVRYFTIGATTSTQISATLTNTRGINIADNRMFISAQSGAFRVAEIGSELHTTTGNAIVNLPGYATATGSPYQFMLFDLNASVAGPDVLYVADDVIGLQKFSLVGGNWVANGVIGADADDYRGVTGVKNTSDNSITLYAVRKGGTGASGGGELVKLTDATGYNADFTATSVTLLATAANNQAFRGVAMAPEADALPVDVLSFTASKTSRAHVLAWTTAQENNTSRYIVERSSNGQTFTTLQTLVASGNQLYNNYQIEDAKPLAGNNFYRLRIEDKDASVRYSKMVRLQANISGGFSVWPNPVKRGSGLIVQHPAASSKASISIYTLEGKLMLQYPVPAEAIQTSLNSPILQAGLYRLLYTDGTKKMSTQISVQ